MVAAALLASTVVSAGASIYAGNKAASAQKDATRLASNSELEMYYQNRDDMSPYREVGNSALGRLAQLYGLDVPKQNRVIGAGQLLTESKAATMAKQNQTDTAANDSGGPDFSSFYESPDYQFAYDQGNRAVNQMLASRGLQNSGAEQKALTKFGQGLASQQYGNYVNRLASMAGIGQTATTQTANMGANVASNVASNQRAAGDARASSYLNTGAAVSNAANNYGQYAMLNAGGYLG